MVAIFRHHTTECPNHAPSSSWVRGEVVNLEALRVVLDQRNAASDCLSSRTGGGSWSPGGTSIKPSIASGSTATSRTDILGSPTITPTSYPQNGPSHPPGLLPTLKPTSTTTTSMLPNNTSTSISSTLTSSASLSSQSTPLKSASINPASIPTWAIVLVVIAGVIGLVFLASLVAFCSKERRRKREPRGKDPSYLRALGRAVAAATGLFIPICIVKRFRRSRENENQERQEMYDSQIPTYGKLEEQSRQSEEVVASTSHVPPAETTLSPATLERGTSVVSSLSSSTRSQGRYERLDIPPSPMSEDGLYPWKSNDPSETASGNIEKREASTGPVESTRVETPLARRSDSISEKRGTGG
ncbi:hypothetical protein F5Y00DRAFT_274707 [Daldinia vernicosa]|uniref:uncharacterized protein n=1 Tax=Daldinia vernicosa TaxID=114800 RepID=UPI002007AB57|nr:uncharacterized protein F5Y00DRAFT_274707 [Daldinia vernicosa]KAI0843950.1 hypothetical protein F5Y00DRAFT_274707 [Daldinia vernicosa]